MGGENKNRPLPGPLFEARRKGPWRKHRKRQHARACSFLQVSFSWRFRRFRTNDGFAESGLDGGCVSALVSCVVGSSRCVRPPGRPSSGRMRRGGGEGKTKKGAAAVAGRPYGEAGMSLGCMESYPFGDGGAWAAGATGQPCSTGYSRNRGKSYAGGRKFFPGPRRRGGRRGGEIETLDIPLELSGEELVFSFVRSRVGRRVPSPPDAGTCKGMSWEMRMPFSRDLGKRASAQFRRRPSA